jgi:hypothetical protein
MVLQWSVILAAAALLLGVLNLLAVQLSKIGAQEKGWAYSALLVGALGVTLIVGLFFGEDVFAAFSAVLLMQAFFAENGIALEPLQIALWGIPTALCAFAIHATRLHRFDAVLARETAALAARRAEPGA